VLGSRGVVVRSFLREWMISAAASCASGTVLSAVALSRVRVFVEGADLRWRRAVGVNRMPVFSAIGA
jgi:hypothetical protein